MGGTRDNENELVSSLAFITQKLIHSNPLTRLDDFEDEIMQPVTILTYIAANGHSLIQVTDTVVAQDEDHNHGDNSHEI